MIVEIAEITVKPGSEKVFENGVRQAAPLFLRAKGCHGLSLHHVVETPLVYRLIVKWEALDNHLVDFRNSDDFQEWRRLVGSCFDGAPNVTHSEAVASYG
ncbi:antibiotic biosynthesis monooxygenase (plasmid) [Sinorhizobium americanum CCGM7]|uniref:antibiotic biosynthesis monooxygenase family protein n=1 Tax=Sinorhizobium americanum TaxID=194963 RepID=UPI0004D95F84|nr:antibiotic biosynthesis monooxygenase family protein [Sinorhizobium americanum]APG89103.1 antibiotic biosynthesis monooxygenase [Sinorhizobium americanum CCGM7]